MPLSDLAVKSAKPREKQYKLSDGEGMYLLVMPNGSKYWKMKYLWAGKEKLLTIGIYPVVPIAEARERRQTAKKQLADNIDPSAAKQEAKRQVMLKCENDLESIIREWHENKKAAWTERHAKYIMRRLEIDIIPALGHRPIADIKPQELLAVLRKAEERDAIDIARRLKQTCGQVFLYAIATGRAERNIAADLDGALKSRKLEHYAKLEESEMPEFLKKLDDYDGDRQTFLALKMIILTMVRTAELRGALWKEIDLAKAEWKIPGERMKMGETHIVPLSRQVLEILEELKGISGHRDHVFPNRLRPRTFISENTLLYALYRMGYHSRATTHGFRATASTILNEHGFRADIIERQLAHAERNKVRASYNTAQYLAERREMMGWWADHLDSLRGSPGA